MYSVSGMLWIKQIFHKSSLHCCSQIQRIADILWSWILLDLPSMNNKKMQIQSFYIIHRILVTIFLLSILNVPTKFHLKLVSSCWEIAWKWSLLCIHNINNHGPKHFLRWKVWHKDEHDMRISSQYWMFPQNFNDFNTKAFSIEMLISLKPVLGGARDVAFFITSHKKTQ